MRKTYFRRSTLTVALATSMAVLPIVSHAQVFWTGSTGVWSDASKWSAGTPGPFDDAINNTVAQITLNVAASINSFTSSGAFVASQSLTGSQINRGSTFKVNNDVSIVGGGINNMTLRSDVNNTYTFNGNGFNFLQNITVADNIQLGGGYGRSIANNIFNSSVTISGLHLQLQDAAQLTVNGSLTGNGQLGRTNGNTFLTNSGTITASGGTLFLDPWNMSGTGTVRSSASGDAVIRGRYIGSGAAEILHNGGSTQVQSGSLEGSFAKLEAAFDGNGSNYISGLTVSGAAALSGGYTRAFGTSSLNGLSTISGLQVEVQDAASFGVGSSGSLTGNGLISRVNGNTFLVNDGTITASSGVLYIDPWQSSGMGTLRGSASGTLVVRGTYTGTGTSAKVLSNGGTVSLQGGAFLGAFDNLEVSFDNNGSNYLSTLTADGSSSLTGGFTRAFGIVSFDGATTIDGTNAQVQDAATWRVNGSLTGRGLIGRVNGNTFLRNDGTITGQGGVLTLEPWQGSGFGVVRGSGSGDVVLRGRYQGLSGTTAKILSNGGKVSVEGGALEGAFDTTEVWFNGDGSNYISGLTTKDAAWNGSYTRAFGTSTITGTGTISGLQIAVQDGAKLEVTSGASLTGSGVISRANGNTFLTNDGTITASGGHLFLDPWESGGAGTLRGSTGSNLIIRGQYQGSGMAALEHNGGQVRVEGGGVYGTFANLEVAFDGNGSNFLSGLTTSAGKLSGSYSRLFATNWFGGNTEFSLANMVVQDGAKFGVSAGGFFSGNGQINRVNGNTFMENNGVIEASGGDLYLDAWNGSNTGTIRGSSTGNVVLRGQVEGIGTAKILSNNGLVKVEGGGVHGSYDTLELSFNGDGANYLSTLLVKDTQLAGAYTRMFGSNKILGTGQTSVSQIALQDAARLEVAGGASLHGSGTLTRANGNTFFTNLGTLGVLGASYRIDAWVTELAGQQVTQAGETLHFTGQPFQSNGTTTVNGTVRTDNPYSLQAGIVKGTGTFQGTLNQTGGVVAPGNSPGQLTVTGNYTMNSNSMLHIEVKTLTAFDVLAVGANANLNGALLVATLPGAVWSAGDTFRILTTGGSRNGSFSVVPNPSMWTVVYGANYVDLVALQAVPEPVSLAALGIGALALLRRRRKSA